MPKRKYPDIDLSLRNFKRSYNRISNEDWNDNPEYAIWKAGAKHAERKLKVLINQYKSLERTSAKSNGRH